MRRWIRFAGLVLLGGGAYVGGCEAAGGAAAHACTPGEEQECSCGEGEPDGTRICDGDGDAWGECDCGGDTDTDADSDVDTETDEDGGTDTDTGYDGPVIPTTCEESAEAMTSVGCDFFVADMHNWDPCDYETYAVVVSNPQEDQDAVVTVEDGVDGVIYTVTLAPGQLDVIEVACASGCLVQPHEIEIQGIGLASGFRLTSDVPVLAYQWNPYGIELYSTDASLLIPRTSLDGTYIVAAWGAGPGASWPQLNSQVTVVITEDDTQISFIPSVAVPALNGVGPIAAGVESEAFTLDAFDVISLSPATLDQDLTGTVVMADKPVVVFGGHSCANVPLGYAACDHVEEQNLPLAAWGTNTVLARHATRGTCTGLQDPVRWRVIAGTDAMTVYFDPPAPAPVGGSHTFAAQGELLEFDAPGDYVAWGQFDAPEDPEHPEAPFFAYQLMMGCTYAATCDASLGDPMMLQSPPAGQYLNRYTFSTDNVFDFDYDHIIIVREVGAEITLDCAGPLPDDLFVAVGTASEWEVGRFYIDDPGNTTGCADGAHTIFAEQPFGLSVVGVADANSYGYLGGVGVRVINPDPVIE